MDDTDKVVSLLLDKRIWAPIILVVGCVVVWKATVRVAWLYMGSVPYLNQVASWMIPLFMTAMAGFFLAGILFGPRN
jgi:hypothetical protein